MGNKVPINFFFWPPKLHIFIVITLIHCRKLIVAKLNWSFFLVDSNGAYSEEFLPVLVKSIFKVLSHDVTDSRSPRSSMVEVPSSMMRELESSGAAADPMTCNRWRERVRLSMKEKKKGTPDFWEKNFKDKTEIPWTEFRAAFLSSYKERILMQMPEDKVSWIINLIYGEILSLKKTFPKRLYVSFCGGGAKLEGDCDRFYHQVMDYARGKIAMKEIFHMDSTVRLIAINNLGKLFLRLKSLVLKNISYKFQNSIIYNSC